MTTIPSLDYRRGLFDERDLATVTSNTRADGEGFLRLVQRIHLDVRTTVYPFTAADRAFEDLEACAYRGSA